jgi:hypothetical protein
MVGKSQAWKEKDCWACFSFQMAQNHPQLEIERELRDLKWSLQQINTRGLAFIMYFSVPRVVMRTITDGQTNGQTDDGRRGVRDLDAL